MIETIKCINCQNEMQETILDEDTKVYYCPACKVLKICISSEEYYSVPTKDNITYIPLSLSPTRDQRKKIEIINKVLCTEFSPLTLHEASSIIEKHYPEVKKRFQHCPATERQLNYIKTITESLNIFCFYRTFDKCQAAEWIDKYSSLYKQHNTKIAHPYIFEDDEYEKVFNKLINKYNLHTFNDLKEFFNDGFFLRVFLTSIQTYAPENLLSEIGYKKAERILDKVQESKQKKTQEEDTGGN